MAPLTRSRSIQPDSIPGELMAKYYAQRASEGGLITTEATNISLTSRGWLGAPGLYTDEQVDGWKDCQRGSRQGRSHLCSAVAHGSFLSCVDDRRGLPCLRFGRS
jgi:N-ethylmaleimide reductase